MPTTCASPTTLEPSYLGSHEGLPFAGFRRFSHERNRFVDADIYLSVEHFVQSEKFRGVDEAYRRRVLSAPTAREARKLALRRDTELRPDWELVQQQVMFCGLHLRARADEPFREALLRGSPDFAKAYVFRDHYWGSHRPGVSVGLYARLLERLRTELLGPQMRVAVVCSASFSNAFLLSAKLGNFFLKQRPAEIVVPQLSGGQALAEHWALQSYVPVFNVFARRGARTLPRQTVLTITDRVTHFVLFRQQKSRDLMQWLSLARSLGVPCRIVDTDGAGRLLNTTTIPSSQRSSADRPTSIGGRK